MFKYNSLAEYNSGRKVTFYPFPDGKKFFKITP